MTINDMNPGDAGWTVPQAFGTGKDNCFYLVGNYSVHPNKQGTLQLRIQRTENGYVVDFTQCDKGAWSLDHRLLSTDLVSVAEVELP